MPSAPIGCGSPYTGTPRSPAIAPIYQTNDVHFDQLLGAREFNFIFSPRQNCMRLLLV